MQLSNLIHLQGSLYITDVLDILIIAFLMYSIFVFIRGTKTTTSVMIGISLAFVLYLVAKTLNLFVTLLALKYFVGVSLVVFVVIFQNEIRKYFEFIGLIGTRQIKVGIIAPHSPGVTGIIQACVAMAQEKTGVLIAVQGKDEIDQFVNGGVELDGIVTEELLSSIFEKHSVGHDGAVIIKNNRVMRFATHLPLSTNFKEIGKHGTRHSAALGLSELSDAMCVVVSEESGKISICKDGRLKTLAQFTDLEKEFEKFIKSRFTQPEENILVRFIKQNSGLKIAAVIGAFIIWYFAAFQAGIIEKSYNVPVILDNLPKDVRVESYSPKEIKIKVKGRGNEVFSKISSKDFKTVFEPSDIQSGVNKLTISPKNISTPVNLYLVSYEPKVILLTAQKYFLADIPVSPKVVGKLTKGYELKTIEVTPALITVWVPQDVSAPSEIPTDTIDISGQKDTVVMPVKLFMPDTLMLESGDSNVNVAITIELKK